tara:strand:+ start:7367 stop:8404 length:1038 start_codon:yes stop_codon:yes gene_type:complete
MSKHLDLTGQRFGRLVAIRRISSSPTYWLCRCDCGKPRKIFMGNLRSGVTKSCGCYGKEIAKTRSITHGLSNTKAYKTWARIKGKNTFICQEWLNNPEIFVAFYEKNIKPGFVMCRKDHTQGYYPKNCIFIPKTELPNQAGSQQRTRFFTHSGKTMHMTAWAEKLGITKEAMRQRVNKWPIEKALTLSKEKKPPCKKIYEYNGESLTIIEWAKKLGITRATLYARMSKTSNKDRIFHSGRQYKQRASQILKYNGECLNIREWAKKLSITEGAFRFRLTVSKDPKYIFSPRKPKGRKKGGGMQVTFNGETMSIPDWSKKLNIPLNRLYKKVRANKENKTFKLDLAT